MAAVDLARTVTHNPRQTIQVKSGVIVEDASGAPMLNVDGANPPGVMWPVGCSFRAGDVVRVLMTADSIEVLPPIVTTPRPLTGQVSGSAAGGFVEVTTTLGAFSCRYTGTPPSVGTLVRLDWTSTQPWVWPGAAASTATTTTVVEAPAAPEPAEQTGKLVVNAFDSWSWAAHRGAWSSTTGSNVQQGSYGSLTYTGAWFYGTQFNALKGKTATSFRIWLGGRLRMGSYNAPATLHVYRHVDAWRGSSEPGRAAFIADIVLSANAPGGWHDLPTSAAQDLITAGGGIAIAGNPYAGVQGLGSPPGGDPQSGRLEIEWKR